MLQLKQQQDVICFARMIEHQCIDIIMNSIDESSDIIF